MAVNVRLRRGYCSEHYNSQDAQRGLALPSLPGLASLTARALMPGQIGGVESY